MGRVSLTESYDDRSVIAKLNEMDKRVTENTTVVTSAEASAKASAQAAQETADRFAGSVGAVVQNANQQMNASKAQVDQAKAEVDATVTTVAQAVQTANDASASAQQSANTVAGYDTRLSAAESKNTQQDTAIIALQTADGQNVKLTGAQNITGIKTVPTEATGTRSQQIANSAKVGAELDNYTQMVRTTGNQEITGIKTFTLAVTEKRNTINILETPTVQASPTMFDIQDKNGVQLGCIQYYRQTTGTNELSIDLCPTGWDGSFGKKVRLRMTVDSEGVGHLVFYDGKTTHTIV